MDTLAVRLLIIGQGLMLLGDNTVSDICKFAYKAPSFDSTF